MNMQDAILSTAIIALLSACAVPTLRLEAEHISHPGAGYPCGPSDEEAQLTQAVAMLHWQKAGWYMDAGLGVKLMERDPRDFVGPTITGTVRVGREFRLVRQ